MSYEGDGATEGLAVVTPFREAERLYRLCKDKKKKKSHKDDFSQVFDFHDLSNNTASNASLIEPLQLSGHKAFTLKHKPGFIILPGFLDGEEQLRLALTSARDFPFAPHHTNFGQTDVPLWQHFMEGRDQKAKVSFQKLQWVTLGWHYNWTTRRYEIDQRFPFPSSLSEPALRAARVTDHLHFVPDSAIVNFYTQGLSLISPQQRKRLTPEKKKKKRQDACGSPRRE